MAPENTQFDGHKDIAQFLEKFREQHPSSSSVRNGAEDSFSLNQKAPSFAAPRQDRAFEKLEEKMRELEDHFEASALQSDLILSELARTREAMETQQAKNLFVDNLAQSIETLKASVETLAKAQPRPYEYTAPQVQRSFDKDPSLAQRLDDRTAIYHYQPDNYRHVQEERSRQEREEKERIISSLHQKASQLKAVNSALDREIKKVQQEKMDALKKSAEQAKEILSLREQLSAAEERFKSFDFEGRIISIKRQYEQKVASLESQLREMSATCIKQVEEIESLKTQNLQLHHAAQGHAEVLARFEAKNQEVQALKAAMVALRAEQTQTAQKQLQVFANRLRELESQRDVLATQLTQVRAELEKVQAEKRALDEHFKRLLVKINENDSIIEGLKQKIDVLNLQNNQLFKEKKTLVQTHEVVLKEKETLQARQQALTQAHETVIAEKDVLAREKQALTHAHETVSAEKDALAREKQALTQAHETVNAEKDALAREKQALTQAHETLGKEKEALLRQNQALNEQTKRLEQWTQPVRPITTPKQPAQPVTAAKPQPRVQPTLPAVPAQAAAKTIEQGLLPSRHGAPVHAQENFLQDEPNAALLAARVTEKKREAVAAAAQIGTPKMQDFPATDPAISAPAGPMPVEAQKHTRTQVQTEADLPEIKVADSIPQPDEPFNGEDFLEKTDSFIGRMKWSIFRQE